MLFDYSKLKGRIKEVFDNQGNFAEKINLSNNTLSKKLNNKVPFTQPEILAIIDLLKLNQEEIHIYFFTTEVEKVQQN